MGGDHIERGWFRAANAAARLGHAVTVLDPEAAETVETLWDQIDGHGLITVISTPSLMAWQMIVAEELPTAEAIAEMLDLSEAEPTVEIDRGAEDDGEID